MKQNTGMRVKRTLADYNTRTKDKGSMTGDKAKRFIESMTEWGYSEDEAFEFFRYVTLGDGKITGEKNESAEYELLKEARDAGFYSKMALKKIGHVGTLMLALNTLNNAREKRTALGLMLALCITSALLLITDDIELLIRNAKGC